MSYGGHVQDMINRMRYNESLKKAKRERIKRVKDALNKGIKKSVKLQDKIDISEEELLKVKEEVRTSMRKEKQRVLLGSWVAVVVVFSVILYLIISWGLI